MDLQAGKRIPTKEKVSRRDFIRLAAGMAISVLLPGCRRVLPSSSPLPVRTGLIDTQRYKRNGPWKLGRSGRGDVTAWMVMFSAHIEYGVKERFKAYFTDYWNASANWDPNKQIEDIKILLKEGIDLLLIDPLDSAVVQAGVERAMNSDVPVILASTRVQSERYVTWVACDEEERGAICADWLCRTVKGGRIVVMPSVPAAGDSTLWLNGVRRRLDGQPSVQEVKVVSCPWSSSEAREIMGSLLHKSTAVDGVVVNNGVLGQGVVQAFTERGIEIPPIAGGDDWNGWLRTAKEHKVRFLGLSGGANLGLRCVELAIQVLAGEPVPGYVAFPYQTFDDSALDHYYRPDLSDHYWAINDLPDAWIERMFKPRSSLFPRAIRFCV